MRQTMGLQYLPDCGWPEFHLLFAIGSRPRKRCLQLNLILRSKVAGAKAFASPKTTPVPGDDQKQVMKVKPATILCIDDEEPGLLVRRALLESVGHRVLTALSGTDGVRIFRSEPVDAVIVDYWMAGKNGLAVARELKRLNRATPIIMLSAYTSLPDETIGLVDLWVQKGGDPQNLLDSLERLLRNRASKAPTANRDSE